MSHGSLCKVPEGAVSGRGRGTGMLKVPVWAGGTVSLCGLEGRSACVGWRDGAAFKLALS